MICGHNAEREVCYHHILTRKARPDLKNEPKNMISVCQLHHNEFHSLGTREMSRKYPSVLNWLLANDWVYDGFSQKWFLSL